MKKISLILALISLINIVSAKSVVSLATPEQLSAAGLTSSTTEIPGGTVIFDNEYGTFSLAYTDGWRTDEDYGIHNYDSSKYRLKVGDSEVFTIGISPAGENNPTFDGYEAGVMSDGSVFKIDAKQTGWMTVFNILFNADKRYVVFENEDNGLPYTLGASDGEYKINYCMPIDDAGYIDLESLNKDRYFSLFRQTNHRPQPPYITAGMETPPTYGMGYMTFKVKAGNSYYVSGLGTRMLCQGFVFTDDATEPAVTFLATDDLPEVKFGIRGTIPLMEGEHFEADGIIYTVIDADAKTVRTKEGVMVENYEIIPGNKFAGDLVIPSVVSDGINDYTVTEIGKWSFRANENLTSVALPESIITIYEGAFGACTNLTSVTTQENLTQIQISTFEGCYNLSTISLPASLEQLDIFTFAGCDALTEITYYATRPIVIDGTYVFNDIIFANTTLNMPNAPLDNIIYTGPWDRFAHIIAADGTREPSEPVNGQIFEYNGLWYTVIDAGAKTCKTKDGNEIGPGNTVEGNIVIPQTVVNGGYDFTVVEIGEKSFYGCEALISISLPPTVEYIRESSFQNCSNLTTIDLPENLIEIRNLAFAGCENLSSIDFPDTVTELGWNTFASCKSLTSIVLPASLKGIGEATFKDCSNLVSVTFPDGFESIGFWGFWNCTSLKSLKFPDTMKVIGELAFQNCSSLETVDFGNSLEGIANHAFVDCISLKSIEFPESLTGIGGNIFGGCTSLTSAIIKSPVTELPGIFSKCTSLEHVELPNTLQILGGSMFDGCSSLVSLNLPNSLRKIEDYAFADCSQLESPIFPTSLEHIGKEAYRNCSKIESVVCPESLTFIGDDAFINCEKLSSITFNEGLTEMGWSVFANCISLESVELPNTLTSLGERVFNDCVNLKSVVFPNSITSIGNGAFWHCIKLRSLNFPSTLEYLGEGTFSRCDSLKTVSFPASLANIGYACFGETYSITNVEYAAEIPVETGGFEGEVYDNAILSAPNATLVNVRATEPWRNFKQIIAKDAAYFAAGTDFEYDGLFYTVLDAEAMTCETKAGHREDGPSFVEDGRRRTGHFGVEGITIPGNYCEGEIEIPSVASFAGNNYTVVGIGKDGFHDCTKLTSVKFPETLVTIGEASFEDAGLTSLSLPASLEEIIHSAFICCKSIREVTFPASFKKLGEKAFFGCENLETIEFPAAIETIEMAFDSCNNIKNVIYNAETPIHTGAMFTGDVYETATLKVPNALLADVRSTESWNSFRNIIAKDGSFFPGLPEGEDFEYEGIWYTIINSEEKTVKTKEGHVEEGDVKIPATTCVGQLVIPEKVTFENNDYTVVEIGYTSFGRNLELTSVILPSSVTRISQDAFYGCPELTSIQMPDNLKFIGQGSFYNCEKLESLNLPASLETIEWAAFIGCLNISSVEYAASEPISGDDGCFDDETYHTATLTMPNANLAVIEATNPWGKFRHIRARNGSKDPSPNDGEDFEYEGIWYTTLDSDAKTVKTKDGFADGSGEGIPANHVSGELVIPSTVIYKELEYTVVEIGHTSFQDNYELTSITLPSTISTIEWDAFYGCNALKSIIIPENVTSIGHGAFFICSGIESLTLPASLNEIGDLAFGGCTSIMSVNYNASTPVSCDSNLFSDEAFENATLNMPNATLEAIASTVPWNKFQHITASNGSIEPGLNEGEEFEYEGIWYTVIDADAKSCRTKSGSVENDVYVAGNAVSGEITIPENVSDGNNDYTVVEVGWVGFANCTELTSISLPSTITSIPESAFNGCSNLTSVNLPSALTSIGANAFLGCEKLSSVVLPENLSSVGHGAFTGCASLTSIVIPESLTLIQNQAFAGCTSLKSIELPATLDGIEYGAFFGCDPNVEVTYNADNPVEADENAFSEDAYANGTLNTPNASLAYVQATVPWNKFLRIQASDGSIKPGHNEGDDFEYEGIWYTVKSREYKTCKTKEGSWNDGESYAGNSVSGDVVIPAVVSDGYDEYTVEEIGTFSFWNNTEMTSVSLPETIIDCVADAFDKCTGLTMAKFASLESLCSIRFYSNSANPLYCAHHLYIGDEELTVINFPESLTEVKGYTFTGGSYITTVNLHEGITSIGGAAFHSCSGLTSINLPQSLTSIGELAFGYCYNLASIELPEGITEIKDLTFDWCRSLSSLTLPSGLTKIGHQAFRNCSSLPSMIIPDGVTSIGSSAFKDCTGLSSVTIPAAVTSFDTSVFSGCTGLSAVNYNAATPIEANDNLFSSDGDIIYTNAILNTPNATLASVQATVPWNKFLHITASDGSIKPELSVGEDFEYEGIWYTVLDAENKTVKTKDGHSINQSLTPGNNVEGDLVIPSTALYGNLEYSVVGIGRYGFGFNTGLTSVIIPETITSIPESAFENCTNLTSVTIPESVTSIGIYAFDECTHLMSVELPKHLESMGYVAFSRCTSITSIVIPESLTILDNNIFSGCSNLKNIDLPATLTQIGNYAFSDCDSNVEIIYRAEVPIEAIDNIFDTDTYQSGTLNTPNATLASVQATVPWNKFLHINASDGSIVPEVPTTSIILSQSSAEMKVGESVTLTATVYPEDAPNKTVTWTSSNPAVATVDANGNVTARSLGQATITASCGNVNATCTVTVISTPATSIILSQSSAELKVGESVNLSATVIPEDATNKTVTWTSSNPAVANVDANGNVTARSLGQTTITASCSNVNATCTVTVVATPASSITISQSSAELKAGEALKLSATVLPEDATDKTITWSSSNTAVATVNSNGNVTAISIGEAIITARCGDTTATCTVTVVPTPAESITVSQSEAQLKVGESVKLSATVLPADATDKTVTWTSSNPAVATVDAYGNVSAISLGQATITAQCGEASATCAVSVVQTPAESISIIQTSTNIHVGESFTLTAQVMPEDATDKTVTWSSSDPAIATVDAAGNVTAISAGQATITAQCGNVTATCSVTVIPNPAKNGEEIDANGITYTVIDEENGYVSTKDGAYIDGEILPGNTANGSLVIPSTVSDGYYDYTVTEIGSHGFSDSDYLTDVTIPATIENIGEDAFSGCERLTSIIWEGRYPLPNEVIDAIGNPNLLIYVDSIQFAPKDMDHNIVVLKTDDGVPVCENLVLVKGYAFTPAIDFISNNSSLTQEFTQATVIGECAGWESLVLPFDVKSIHSEKRGELTPFAALTDIEMQCPFWLYEAAEDGEWKEASNIRAGVPYIISMPNNPDYLERYNIDGPVKFACNEPTMITREITTPYAVNWASGQAFRSMWLPLDEKQAANAMGLNVGISGMTDDNGDELLPGSAFCEGVTPRPLEAYVTRQGAESVKRIFSDQVGVRAIESINGLEIKAYIGKIIITSDKDRKIDIFATDGTHIRRVIVKAGTTETVNDLTRGLYLIAGQKILVK